MKILLLFIFISSSVFADDIFIPIKKGEPAPISGYIISKPNEKKVRQKVSDLEHENNFLKRIGESQEKQIKEYVRYIDVQRNHNMELRSELRKKTGFWEKTGYFITGVLATSLIGYGALQAVR